MFILYLSSTAQSQLLWKIEHPEWNGASWIFGTMHARCAENIEITPALSAVLEAADVLALELDLADPTLALSMAKHAFMPKDSTLNKLLTPGAYDTLTTFLRDSLNLQVTMVSGMKPLFLIGLLIGKILECTPVAYEDRLMSMATTFEKRIIGLETAEEQLAAFASISLREQAGAVLEMILNIEETREEFRKLEEVYVSEDIEALVDLLRQSGIEYGRFEGPLLKDRNHRWIKRIFDISTKDSVLYAVGAGHLGGSDGLLVLLRQRGCTTTPINQTVEERH